MKSHGYRNDFRSSAKSLEDVKEDENVDESAKTELPRYILVNNKSYFSTITSLLGQSSTVSEAAWKLVLDFHN